MVKLTNPEYLNNIGLTYMNPAIIVQLTLPSKTYVTTPKIFKSYFCLPSESQINESGDQSKRFYLNPCPKSILIQSVSKIKWSIYFILWHDVNGPKPDAGFAIIQIQIPLCVDSRFSSRKASGQLDCLINWTYIWSKLH